jgi:hypothetical protein
MAKEEGGGNWRSLPQLLSHHKHYKSMSQRPIGKRVTKDVKVWTKGRDHVMNKLFNGQKHKPKVTQNCPLDFPKFTPSPNLGGQPPLSFFLLSLEWSMETQRRQTTKPLVVQCKRKGTIKPPTLHGQNNSLGKGPRMGAFRKWKKGGPRTKMSHDFGEHPSPFARVWGSYTDSKFSLSKIPYKL